jgi:3-hexulose-6-phosphate synthase/6-phospho-3-hexuloisomerase
VIGAPLAIDADSFSQGAGNVEEVLRKICYAVHGFGDVKVKGEK